MLVEAWVEPVRRSLISVRALHAPPASDAIYHDNRIGWGTIDHSPHTTAHLDSAWSLRKELQSRHEGAERLLVHAPDPTQTW